MLQGRTLDELDLKEKELLVNAVLQRKRGESDRDWDDICEEFDLDLNSNTLRKAGIGIKLMADVMEAAERDEGDTGYIERQKLRDLTRNITSVYRAESRSGLLREAIADAIKRLPPINIETPARVANCENDESKTLVLALGDFHYGADIHVEGLRGETINEYNDKVFEERMTKLLYETAAILEKENIDKVEVLLVGDLIDGMLRQSALMRLQYGMVESTIRLSEFLAAWIAELSLFASVGVHGALGNHSEIRPLKAKAREFEDENLEKIIMWYLASRLADHKNIFVDGECKSRCLVEVEGFNFLIVHGDGAKNLAGISESAINLYGEPIDYFVCGHLHKEQEYTVGVSDGGNSVVIRVPSLCGIDRYAQSKGYGGMPGATAIVMEKRYGRRCVYPIIL